MALQVVLVSAERTVWTGEASMVVARSVEGDLGVLPGHAPVLAVLAAGEVRITPLDGAPVVAVTEGGFLSVEHDRVTVVADSAALAGSGAR